MDFAESVVAWLVAHGLHIKYFVVPVDFAQRQWELVSWCAQEIVFDWLKLHVDWLEQLGNRERCFFRLSWDEWYGLVFIMLFFWRFLHEGLCRGCRFGARAVRVSELVWTRDRVRLGEVTCRLAWAAWFVFVPSFISHILRRQCCPRERVREREREMEKERDNLKEIVKLHVHWLGQIGLYLYHPLLRISCRQFGFHQCCQLTTQ